MVSTMDAIKIIPADLVLILVLILVLTSVDARVWDKVESGLFVNDYSFTHCRIIVNILSIV